jgi:cold-inducible RNA-binding protein
MRLYVANLAYGVGDDELRAAFEAHGKVTSAKVIRDRDTGQSRGFGFVEMESASEGSNAIEKMNGYSLSGRPLRVNEAQPRDDNRPPRSGGGGFGGGSSGGGAPAQGGNDPWSTQPSHQGGSDAWGGNAGSSDEPPF